MICSFDNEMIAIDNTCSKSTGRRIGIMADRMHNKHILCLILICIALAIAKAGAEPRTWTSVSGSTINASLLKVELPYVYLLNESGTTSTIPLLMLSDVDLQLLGYDPSLAYRTWCIHQSETINGRVRRVGYASVYLIRSDGTLDDYVIETLSEPDKSYLRAGWLSNSFTYGWNAKTSLTPSTNANTSWAARTAHNNYSMFTSSYTNYQTTAPLQNRFLQANGGDEIKLISYSSKGRTYNGDDAYEQMYKWRLKQAQASIERQEVRELKVHQGAMTEREARDEWVDDQIITGNHDIPENRGWSSWDRTREGFRVLPVISQPEPSFEY